MSCRDTGKLTVLITWGMCLACLPTMGCKREAPAPGDGETAIDAPGADPPEGEAGIRFDPITNRPVGADDRDDPRAPRALPRTDEVRDWIKTRPVQVAEADKLADLVDDPALLAALQTFRLRLAARCAYGNGETSADVLLLEATTPQDAFGAFSILSPAAGEWSGGDGSVRASETSDGGLITAGWQGTTCVRLACTGVTGKSEEQACGRLRDRILFNVPAAEPPLLLRLIPPEDRDRVQLWLVRSTVALGVASEEALRRIDPQEMDTRLGLDGDAVLSIAAVEAPGEQERNLIWAVHYPDPADADAAFKRYQRALPSPESPLDADTIVYEPKGRFLAGSWTAALESVQMQLGPLRQALPEPQARSGTYSR